MKKRGRRRIEEADHRTSFLKSVERTLDVLEFLSKNRSIGITELADIIHIGSSTAHRILSTLEKKGFAVQDPETGKYALGHMVFQLAKSVIHMIEPVKYVRPYLRDLCGKIGENIAFGVVTPAKDRTFIVFKKQLTRFHKLGYTLSRDEFSVGLSAMASGICDAENKFKNRNVDIIDGMYRG